MVRRIVQIVLLLAAVYGVVVALDRSTVLNSSRGLGIIGGADGPTVIYTAGRKPFHGRGTPRPRRFFHRYLCTNSNCINIEKGE